MIVKAVLKYAILLVLMALVLVYPEKAAELFVVAVTSLWELAVNIARSIHFPGKKEAASAIIMMPGIFQVRRLHPKTSEQKEHQSNV